MLQALTLTLGEGLSAFLVVGVMLAIFRRAGEERLIAAVQWGLGLSVLATLVATALYAQADNQALWEALLSLLAAAAVAWMTVHLWHVTRRRRERWRPGPPAVVATSFIAVLMIARGTMEVVLLLGIMVWQVPAAEVIFGVVAGIGVAVATAWLWARYARLLSQRRFRQVTAIFLIAFLVQLLVDGLHELSEARVLTAAVPWQQTTAAFSSDGVYGRFTPYLLVVLPVVWWLIALFWDHGKAPDGRVAHLDR